MKKIARPKCHDYFSLGKEFNDFLLSIVSNSNSKANIVLFNINQYTSYMVI